LRFGIGDASRKMSSCRAIRVSHGGPCPAVGRRECPFLLKAGADHDHHSPPAVVQITKCRGLRQRIEANSSERVKGGLTAVEAGQRSCQLGREHPHDTRSRILYINDGKVLWAGQVNRSDRARGDCVGDLAGSSDAAPREWTTCARAGRGLVPARSPASSSISESCNSHPPRGWSKPFVCRSRQQAPAKPDYAACGFRTTGAVETRLVLVSRCSVGLDRVASLPQRATRVRRGDDLESKSRIKRHVPGNIPKRRQRDG
jgi:hypothetical protein